MTKERNLRRERELDSKRKKAHDAKAARDKSSNRLQSVMNNIKKAGIEFDKAIEDDFGSKE